MQQHLDGAELPDRAALEAHLAGCPDCREWFVAAQRLVESLRALPIPPEPADLADRVVKAVLAQRRRMRLRRWLAAGAAVAAAFLLAALIGFPGPSSLGPEQKPQVNVKEDRPQEAEFPAAPSLGQSVADARSAVAALTGDLTARTKSQAQLLWTAGQPSLPAVEELEQPLEPVAQSLRESGRGVSVSLATVTGSARRAVSYFVRELPPLQN